LSASKTCIPAAAAVGNSGAHGVNVWSLTIRVCQSLHAVVHAGRDSLRGTCSPSGRRLRVGFLVAGLRGLAFGSSTTARARVAMRQATRCKCDGARPVPNFDLAFVLLAASLSSCFLLPSLRAWQ